MAMVTKARALGNPTALSHARTFLRSWRACGTPLPNSPSSLLQGSGQLVREASSTQNLATGQSSFGDLWGLLTRCEEYLGAAHVPYRWGMAFLAQRYSQEIARIEESDRLADRRGGGRDGQGKVRSEAKRLLLQDVPLVTPEAFTQRLKRAQRWHTAAQTLG